MADEVEAGVLVEEPREDAAASADEAVAGEVQDEVALLQAEEEEGEIQISQGLLGDFEGVDHNNNGRRYRAMGLSMWEYQRYMWIGQ